MIRWYDYVFAFLMADLMSFFLIKGTSTSTWWEPILYGLAVGFFYQFWKNTYCILRLKQEQEHGK